MTWTCASCATVNAPGDGACPVCGVVRGSGPGAVAEVGRVPVVSSSPAPPGQHASGGGIPPTSVVPPAAPAGQGPRPAVVPGAKPASPSSHVPLSSGGRGTKVVAVAATVIVLALVAVAATVALSGGADDEAAPDGGDDTVEATSSSSSTTPTTEAPTTTAGYQAPDASPGLQYDTPSAIVAADASAVEGVLDQWIPQLGTHSMDTPEADVVAKHRELAASAPGERVALVRTTDFTSFEGDPAWVTVVLTRLPTGEDVLDWCRDHDLWDNKKCLGKILSRTLGPGADTNIYIPTTVPG